MDIQHNVNALAALTLGKDMTFRDYAQGAYRMRGIAKGQVRARLLTSAGRRRRFMCLANGRARGGDTSARAMWARAASERWLLRLLRY